MSSLTLIKVPEGWGTRSVGQKRIKSAFEAKAAGLELEQTKLQKLKDWWCGTDTLKVLECLYQLKVENDTDTLQPVTPESLAKKKFESYLTLASLITPGHRHRLEVSSAAGSTPSELNIKFNIEGLGEEFPLQTLSLVQLDKQEPLEGIAEKWGKVQEYAPLPQQTEHEDNPAVQHVLSEWSKVLTHYSSKLESQMRTQFISERQKVPYTKLKEFDQDFLAQLPKDTQLKLEICILDDYEQSDASTEVHATELKRKVTLMLDTHWPDLKRWELAANDCVSNSSIDHPRANEIKKKVYTYIQLKGRQLTHPPKPQIKLTRREKVVKTLCRNCEESLKNRGYKLSDKKEPHWTQIVDEYIGTRKFTKYNSEDIKLEVRALMQRRREVLELQLVKYKDLLEAKRRQTPEQAAAAGEAKAPDGFISMESQSHLGQVYYYDKERVFPAIRKPESQEQLTQKPAGSFKTLQARDTDYVELAALRPGSRGGSRGQLSIKESNDLKRKQLSALKEAVGLETERGTRTLAGTSIAPGLQGIYTNEVEYKEQHSHGTTVETRTKVLAANGGRNIGEIIRETHQVGKVPTLIPLKAYKQLCLDVKKAHLHHIYFRDLKNGNLLYNTHLKTPSGKDIPLKEPKVMLIDIDDVVTLTEGVKRYENVGTYDYITEGLQQQIRASKNDAEKQAVQKQADNYALLLNILYATTPHMVQVKSSRKDKHQYTMPFEKGVLDHYKTEQKSAKNVEDIKSSIKGVVHQHNWNKVERFFENPVQNPLDESVFDVIDWDKVPDSVTVRRSALKRP